MISELTRTSTLLLQGLHDPANQDAWDQFHRRCYPMLLSYARRRGLQEADAEDAAQETLTDFARAYQEGQYDRSRGRLRQWIHGFASRRVAKARSRNARAAPVLNCEGRTEMINRVPSADDVDQVWQEEWERHVLSLCQAQVRQEFDDRQLRAFERYAVEGHPVNEVAEDMGMSTNAVYICKTRILSRLRELQAELAEVW